jgi:hypothetical protein
MNSWKFIDSESKEKKIEITHKMRNEFKSKKKSYITIRKIQAQENLISN